MSLPELRHEGDVLILTWPAVGVRAEVEQLRREHHDLVGEVTWYILDPLVEYPHLHGAKLNMSSTSAQTSLTRHLRDRTNGLSIDWPVLIEQVCVFAKREDSRGEPFVKIGHGTDGIEDRRYRIERLLEENQITMAYGDSGAGKSTIAVASALSVEAGIPILGLSPEPGRVLYLDYETDSTEQDKRIRRIAHGFGLDDCPEIDYRRMILPLADDIGSIRRHVDSNGITLVIVDSVGFACGGKPEDAETSLRMYLALRQLNVTKLLLHHVTGAQSREKGRRHPFGSVYHVNVPRAHWEIRAAPETESATLRLALYNRWSNNAPRFRPMGYAVTFAQNATYIKASDMMGVAELAAGVSIPDQIANALRGGALSVQQLGELVDTTEGTIRSALNRGKERFVKVEDKWGLRIRA
jgi:energy-coupling factor transporter ATP-binding protein EcfA2